MWRDLPESDKQEFVDEYETEKADYERAVKDYHASASYQAYLSAKSKGRLGLKMIYLSHPRLGHNIWSARSVEVGCVFIPILFQFNNI